MKTIPAMHRRRFLAAVPAGLAATGLAWPAAAAEPTGIRPDDPTGFLGRRSPVFTRRCVASSSSPLVTQVGLRVLEDGGNAFDAAVAMAGMMAVVEPMMSGLGGDTMILVWSAIEKKVFGLNGSSDPLAGLKQNCTGVPMMTGLDEQRTLEPMLTSHGAQQNIWFEIINMALE
jgi:hypothetical protein